MVLTWYKIASLSAEMADVNVLPPHQIISDLFFAIFLIDQETRSEADFSLARTVAPCSLSGIGDYTK